MKRKIALSIVLTILLGVTGCGRQKDDGIVRTEWSHTYDGYPVVYVAHNVSAGGLLSAYESLEASFDGTAAIKLSETDTDKDFSWSDLVVELSESLDEPVVVESPSSVDFSDYGCTIVLSHFRSHDAAGFNGAVKQTAIISAKSETASRLSAGSCNLKILAESGKRTVDSLEGHILYINVMDRATIESAGVVLPESNTYNIAILASYDPVALDQACIDILTILRESTPLLSHIAACDGLYTLTYGEQIGLGSRTYALMILEN
ncbi:MAG: DUF362 domain-containing protein [Oscillospiraceae bacterium]|nr:DUF362 domain-containing protein [Oscillospiraceae bacterium]